MPTLTEDENMPIKAKKALCALISALLVAGCIPLSSFADGDALSTGEVSGTYSYTTNEAEINQQGTDTFVYRDECFTNPSYDGCEHLATLSAQIAIASSSRYGDDVDPDQSDDPSDNARNVLDMLTAMGFADVETNKYYTIEKQKNSAAAALGRRTVEADGKSYTLIAVIPRSAGYKQEWAGNFDVGGGDFHEGFKQGRDEILRFVKKYIADHGITGDLKIWIAGHSRGAALANSLGGFFAGGGASYFDNITITPGNVYCYTFATPNTVKESVSKKAYLSVSGARQDPVYADDTQVEEYVYPEEGTIDPHDPVFDCVRNYKLPFDFITMLPLAEWGYTCFGKLESYDMNGVVTAGEMLAQLKVFAPFAYEEFVNGGDYRTFSMKTLDLALLEIVDDPSAPEKSFAGFLEERMHGLAHVAPSGVDYSTGGYETTMKALAGLYGMLHGFKGISLEGLIQTALEPLLLTYIAYGRDQLKAEGRLDQGATDAEAASAVICDLLSYVTGSEITGDTKVDVVLTKVLEYVVTHEGSPLYNKLIETAGSMLPQEGFTAEMVKQLLLIFVTDPNATDEEMIGAFLKACVYGPEDGTLAKEGDTPASDVRGLIYTVLGLSDSKLEDALGFGNSPASSLIEYALDKLLVKEKDQSGAPVEYYSSLDEAADGKLADVMKSILQPMTDAHSGKYGDLFDQQLMDHYNTLLSGNNVRNLRNVLTSMLLYSEGEPFGAKTAVGNAATFVQCVPMIPLTHYNEVYIAWCKAIEVRLNGGAPVPTGDTGIPVAVLIPIICIAASVPVLEKKRRSFKRG